MAGCSKKQYAIMMNSGPEGKKLASKMGKMDQEDFNAAFEELINSGAADSFGEKAPAAPKDKATDFRKASEMKANEAKEELKMKGYTEKEISEGFPGTTLDSRKYFKDDDEYYKQFDADEDSDYEDDEDYYEAEGKMFSEKDYDKLEKYCDKYGEDFSQARDKLLTLTREYDNPDRAMEEVLDDIVAGDLSKGKDEDDSELEKETQETLDKSDYVMNDKGQAVPRKYDEKYGSRKESKKYIKKNGMIIVVDEDGKPTGEQYPSEDNANDINGSIKDWEEVEEKTQSEAESNNLDPNNPKYKDKSRSAITNAKLVDEGYEFTNADGEKVKESIIEYIPYGALQDGDNRKLYGIVRNYDGSDAPNTGAIVATSLEDAKEQLERQVKLGIQGSDRYLGRGKYDEEFFNIMRDYADDNDSDDVKSREEYSKKYGWDFNKPFKEHDFMKDDPYEKWKSEREAANNTPAEFSQLKAKMPNGKEMSLFDFAHNISNLLDNETAANIIADKFGVSEKDALAYLESPYNKEGSKEDYENKLKNSYK